MVNEFKVIGFDLDGTLIDSVVIWLSLFKKVLKKFKIEVSEKDIKNQFGKESDEIVKALAPKEKTEEVIKDIKKERKDKLDSFKLFPFAKKVLQDIREKGIKTSIITGNDSEINNFFMEKFKLDRLTDYNICAGDVRNGKPSPDMILGILRTFALSKKGLLYIGDTVNDIEMGKNAGIKTGVVLTGVLDRKSAEKVKPDFIFEDVRDVLELI